MRRRTTLSLVLAALVGLAVPGHAQDSRRAFSFPLTREARDTARLALDHLTAQRWSKAIDVLQDMTEEQVAEARGLATAWRASHGGAVRF